MLYLVVGNVGNFTAMIQEKGIVVSTRIVWAAISTTCIKGFSYSLQLRSGIVSTTLRAL